VIYSKFKEAILELLKKYNFIKDFSVKEEGKKKFIIIYLNEVKDPINDIPVIKFYSKPGRRWYVSYRDLKPVAGGK
jgi:ribosomal protein S8